MVDSRAKSNLVPGCCRKQVIPDALSSVVAQPAAPRVAEVAAAAFAAARSPTRRAEGAAYEKMEKGGIPEGCKPPLAAAHGQQQLRRIRESLRLRPKQAKLRFQS